MKMRNAFENKEVIKSIRLNEEEHIMLQEEASLARLSVSEYIRSRLFQDEVKTTERVLMQFVIRMFGMVEKLALKTLDRDARLTLEKEAQQAIKRLGYE